MSTMHTECATSAHQNVRNNEFPNILKADSAMDEIQNKHLKGQAYKVNHEASANGDLVRAIPYQEWGNRTPDQAIRSLA